MFPMHVGIYSLQQILYQGDAESINCMTASGEITALANHRPLISILKQGIVTVVDKANQKHYIRISSGFLEVRRNNQARIIVTEQE